MPTEIGGIIIAPIVAALTEALKALGMPVKYAGYANVVLSATFWLLAQAYNALPGYDNWIKAGIQIAVIILAASGFYEEGIKRFTKKRFNKK